MGLCSDKTPQSCIHRCGWQQHPRSCRMHLQTQVSDHPSSIPASVILVSVFCADLQQYLFGSAFKFTPPCFHSRGGLSYAILQVSGAWAKSGFRGLMFLLNGWRSRGCPVPVPCLTLTLYHGDDITSWALRLHKSPFPSPGKDFPKPQQNKTAALEQPLSETQEHLRMSGHAQWPCLQFLTHICILKLSTST